MLFFIHSGDLTVVIFMNCFACFFFSVREKKGQAVKTYSVEQTPHTVCTWSYIHWWFPYPQKHLVYYRKRNARNPKVFFPPLSDHNDMTNTFQVHMWNKYYRIKVFLYKIFTILQKITVKCSPLLSLKIPSAKSYIFLYLLLLIAIVVADSLSSL